MTESIAESSNETTEKCNYPVISELTGERNYDTKRLFSLTISRVSAQL